MKKNLVKKAVLPALAALVCSVIALTSVSYAWFSMGNNASVDGMEMKVTSAGGLQISATGDEGSFKSHLVLSDLDIDGNSFPKSVVPVSTSGSLTNGSLTFYTGEIVDGELGEIETSTSYIVFDIYVKVNVANKLYLENSTEHKSTVTCADKDTEYAARVGFVDLGCAPTALAAQQLTGKDVTGPAKIWEPNSTSRAQAYLNAGGKLTGKQGYSGISAADGAATAVTTFDFTETVTSSELCELEAGYNRIRVYVWLEGQDIDCLNEVSGGLLSIALSFRQDTPQQQAE